MQFYPSLSLAKNYFKAAPSSEWFSHRVQDLTLTNTNTYINHALNMCEKNDTFLDFGAGNGRYSIALLSIFERGYGIEIVENAYLKKIAEKSSKFKALFGENAVKDIKEKIDFIQLIDVIEHIEPDKLDKLLNSFSRLQNKGGVIFILTPNPLRCGVAPRSGIYYKKFPFGHHKHYLAQELVHIFSDHGYTRIFEVYEDFQLKLFLRKMVLFVSGLDKKLQRITFYELLSLPVIWLFNTLLYLVSRPVMAWEYAHRSDYLRSRTEILAFKKIA